MPHTTIPNSTAGPQRVVIVGGGVTGLSAAHRLDDIARAQRRPIEIILLEASDRLGGVIRTHRRDDYLIESGPDQFITARPWAVDLARRLGIDGEIQPTTGPHPRVLIGRGARLLPLPEGFMVMAPTRMWPMATTPLLSWRGKCRAIMDLLLPARREDGDESIAAFIRRRFGREMLDRIVEPLIGSIYGAPLDQLSVRATMSRFVELEQKDRSLILAMRRQGKKRSSAGAGTGGPRYGMFVTFRNGLQTLVDALTARVGNFARLGVEVRAIERTGTDAPRYHVALGDGGRIDADAVLVAAPGPSATKLLSSLDEALTGSLASIPYGSTSIVHLAYRRDQVGHALDAYGIVCPPDERGAVNAASFSSIKYPGRAPDDMVLLRGIVKPDRCDGDASDDSLAAAAHGQFSEWLAIRGAPAFSSVDRWDRVLAHYRVGHPDRIAGIEQRLEQYPGLELAGNAYRGVGIPDCIHSGETAAERLAGGLGSRV
ncbi:MAG: protoporphyrinogen oxidase [Phycisphaeraceae bacterium]|nr:protoporphyrinogen oxidase [Phycisphaeraceae bacterium]